MKPTAVRLLVTGLIILRRVHMSPLYSRLKVLYLGRLDREI